MKNLKAQYKLIICFFLFLNISNVILAKNSDNFSDSNDVSNYFSGIVSMKDNQYKKSYAYLKSLRNLEDSHYNYAQYYQFSLVALNKFKDAANYSKTLEKKKIDNFESNLISVIYDLKNNNFKNVVFYLQSLRNKSKPGTVQNLLSTSLDSWINFKDISELDVALKLLNTIPERFDGIKKIQKAFAYCYYESLETNEIFKELTSSTNVNYSRYNFFHANYLISKNNKKKAKKIIESSLEQSPKNLLLKQLKLDLENEFFLNNKFDCKNITDVIAEVFYVASNALASQNNYIASNFYLSLSKYLNPNFVSFEALYAENLFLIQEYTEARKAYAEIKKKGSIYNWHASKKIASIFIKEGKKETAIKSLNKSFGKKAHPTIYEIFDYAEFLKNNEIFNESIEYYTTVLNLIDTKNVLYSQAMDGRGVAYERTGQWDKAEIDLLNSLNSSPDNPYVINYLAYSWIEKGINIKESLEMLKKANKLRPDDGYILDSLGWALFKLKNYKEAKKYLEAAIQYMASDPVINDHFADTLWMNNKSLQARYYWNYVLKLEKTEEKLRKKIKKKLVFGIDGS